MTENALYQDGEPRNLAAAALDALTWLHFFEQKYILGECGMTVENHVKLCRTIASLSLMVKNAIMEFSDTEQQQ